METSLAVQCLRLHASNPRGMGLISGQGLRSHMLHSVAKNNKNLDLIKLKSFSIAKKTIDKMKRQPAEWEKILANDMTNKRLIFKV